MGAFSNAGLICFTMETLLQNWSNEMRVWFFIFTFVGILVFQRLIMWYCGDLPEEVSIQLGRQKFMMEVFCDKVHEDGDSDEEV